MLIIVLVRYLDQKILIIGSVMILFEGYMGTILHTGDFRFTTNMITSLPLLYPPSKQNPNREGCSIHIDELIMDDTYCDPAFQFPKRVCLVP